MATTKAKAKPATAKTAAAKPASSRSQRVAAEREALLEKIGDMLEQGLTVTKIQEKLKLGSGKTAFLVQMAKVAPKDRFKWREEDELQEWVVKARREMKLSWGLIMIRAGISEAKARGLYRKAGYDDKGDSIGKGGRSPNGTTRATSTKTKAKPAAKGSARTGRGKAAPVEEADATEPKATPATTKAKARVRRRSGTAAK